MSGEWPPNLVNMGPRTMKSTMSHVCSVRADPDGVIFDVLQFTGDYALREYIALSENAGEPLESEVALDLLYGRRRLLSVTEEGYGSAFYPTQEPPGATTEDGLVYALVRQLVARVVNGHLVDLTIINRK